MLTVSNVFAGYGGIDVIKDISMNITGNLSIVGPNGCGKTTLLKAMANILPFRGEIEVFGRSFKDMSRREISLDIAMLNQRQNIYFDYSVFDTVMMGRYLYIKDALGRPSAEDERIVIKSLEAVNLVALKDKLITRLSGGELQRVLLARTLAQEPRAILLDEPTNHLDLKCQMEIVEYLKDWAGEGERLVIGVMHDINLALRLSDDLVVMKDGEIKAYGKADDIISQGILEQVYEMEVRAYMQESLGRWVYRENALDI